MPETAYENEITCPGCGRKDRNACDFDEDSVHEIDCDCGCTYSMERDIAITYLTKIVRTIKENEDKDSGKDKG